MGLWGQVQHEFGVLLLVALALVVAYLLRRIGVLPFSPTESAAVDRADRAEGELAKANQRIGELEQTRSMKPIIEALQTNAELQAQVMDRLAHHNGSFQHVEKSLSLIEHSLQTLTGFIVGVAELSPAQVAARRSRDTPS